MSLRRFAHLSFPAVAATAVSVLFLASASARADVKLVTRNTTSGAAGPAARRQPGTQTVTTFYKGSKVRMETGENIILFDSAAGTMMTLNPAQKTYYKSDLKSTLGQAQGMMAMMDFKTKADVRPGGKTKTILGKPAKNYLWTANISMGFKAQAAKSGAPGGGVPPAMVGKPLMTINIQGEQWSTEAVKLPGTTSASSLSMSAGLNQIPGFKPLIAKLSVMKGLPLASTTTQNFTMNMQGMGGPGAGGGPAGGGQKQAMTMKTEALSLSEAPLPASLFTVPAGYKLIASPSAGPGRRPMPGR